MLRVFTVLILLISPLPAPADAQLGLAAPEVRLPLLASGEEMALADLRGKVVYVDFWASWCAPCRQSLPALEAIRNRYRNDFEVFAINVDEDPLDARRFLERYPVSYPVLSDASGETPARFGIKGMPTSYIIDRDGVVRYMHEGYRDGDREKIEALVLQLIAE